MFDTFDTVTLFSCSNTIPVANKINFIVDTPLKLIFSIFSFLFGPDRLDFISVWGVERETSVFATSVPKEMGIYGSIVRVCGFDRDGLQVGLFGCPQVVPGSPQEAGILANRLGVLGLHLHRPLEVVLSSVKISNTYKSILGIKTKASTSIVRKKEATPHISLSLYTNTCQVVAKRNFGFSPKNLFFRQIL